VSPSFRVIAVTAAERQSPHSGRREDARRCREPESVRGVIEVSERGATTDRRQPCVRVDVHVPDGREVDYQAVLDRSEPRNAVATTANRDVEPAFPAHLERRNDVARVRAADDQPGTLVDAPVVNLPRLLVLRILAVNQSPAYATLEGADEIRVPCECLCHQSLLRGL
jgi:hypothetical protein